MNEDDAKTDEQKSWFADAKKAIEDEDISANDLDAGYLRILKNYCLGDANYSVVKKIDNLTYENTDSVFGVFSLGGYQDGPFIEDSINFNYLLSVYAIKGDNLIQINYRSNTWEDLGVEDSAYVQCIDDEYAEMYDLDCVRDVFKEIDNDSTIEVLVNRMLRTFAIKE